MRKSKNASGGGRWLLPALLVWGCNNGSPVRESGASGDVDATPFGRGMIPTDGSADRGAASDADAREVGASGDAIADTPADVPITCMPACMDGQICLDTGQCQTVCQQGQTNCPTTGCTDLFIDSKNCGLCGKACPQGQFCSDGKCATMCGQGETKCGQSCVKLDSNYANCGLCGQTCHDAEACVANMCRCETPNQVCNNVCTHVINNRSNCGRCGNQCQGDYVCNGSNCGCPGGRQSCPNKPNTCVANLNDCCASGQVWCGHCQDIVSDRNNCGSCGKQCPGVEVCSNRSCGCPSSQPKSCGGGVCLPNDQCCSFQRSCGGGVCLPNDQCCASAPKSCGGGRCIATNQCCDDRPQCGGVCCPGGQVCLNNACVTPVDCVVGPFGDWSTCDKDCGPGTQTRHRMVITPPSNGGAACPPLDDTQSCKIKDCPVDCVIKFPDNFGMCSKSCGGGTQSRTAVVVVPASGGGMPCPDPLPTQTQDCNTQDCPVDCVFKFPDNFGMCSVACGGGTQSRTAIVVTPASGGGKPCPDPLPIDTQTCNTNPCPVDAGSNGNGNGNGN